MYANKIILDKPFDFLIPSQEGQIVNYRGEHYFRLVERMNGNNYETYPTLKGHGGAAISNKQLFVPTYLKHIKFALATKYIEDTKHITCQLFKIKHRFNNDAVHDKYVQVVHKNSNEIQKPENRWNHKETHKTAVFENRVQAIVMATTLINFDTSIVVVAIDKNGNETDICEFPTNKAFIKARKSKSLS